MKRLYISLLCVSMLPIGAFSQDDGNLPSRSMTIEGVYNANVTDADKIMSSPERPKVETMSHRTEYNTSTQPYYGYVRDASATPAVGNGDESRVSGIAEVGYGVKGDLVLLGDVRVKSGQNSLFKATLNGDGWNAETEDDWRSKFYDFGLDLGYSYNPGQFKLDVNGNFGYGYNNFRRDPLCHTDLNLDRNVVLGGLNAAVTSLNTGSLTYTAMVGWDMFLDDRCDWKYNKGSENIVRLKGDMTYVFDDRFTAAADISLKVSLYNCRPTQALFAYDNYTSFSFTPKVMFNIDDVDVTAGVNMLFRTTASPVARFAPYIKADYRFTDNIKAFAQVTGGTDEYGMKQLREMTPYWINNTQIFDGYTPVDALLGVRLNTSFGLELSLQGGYRKYFDKVFQIFAQPGMFASSLVQYDADLGHVDLAARYSYSDRIKAYASIDYNSWSTDEPSGIVLEMVPELNIKVGGELKVLDRLTANLDFHYSMMNKCDGRRLPYIANLDIALKYALLSNLDIWLKGTSLLCHRYYRYAGYRDNGSSVVASVLYRF